jgi:uncharacterized membrane protein
MAILKLGGIIMKKERLQDLIVSMIVLVISLIMYLNTKALTPPSDIFPKLVIGITAVLGIFLLGKSLFTKGFYEKQAEESDDEQKGKKGRIWIGIGALILYVVILPLLGFFITSALFIILVSSYLMGKANPVRAGFAPVIVSVAILGVIYTVFYYFLHVPVPRGILF